MARHSYPPKGYRNIEYPLWHEFNYLFAMSAEVTNKNSTMLTLLRASEASTDGIEAVEVNPKHGSFGVETGPTIAMGSIVPKMMFKLEAHMSKTSIVTDNLRNIAFNWVPLYFSFLDSLTAEDDKTAVTIEDIFELEHDTTNKDVNPNYGGIDLTADNHPLGTILATDTLADYGLSTLAVLEDIAYDENLLWKAMRYYTNKGMLSKVMGKWHTVILERDKTYSYYSNNFTNPTIKRGNPYTYCGILVHVPQAGSINQTFTATDTSVINHIDFRVRCAYEEWNQDFDQTAQ